MSPPRNLDLVQTLQQDWRCCMKKREDKIKSQRGVNVTDGQIITRPSAEKNECRESGQNLNSHQPSFDQR